MPLAKRDTKQKRQSPKKSTSKVRARIEKDKGEPGQSMGAKGCTQLATFLLGRDREYPTGLVNN